MSEAILSITHHDDDSCKFTHKQHHFPPPFAVSECNSTTLFASDDDTPFDKNHKTRTNNQTHDSSRSSNPPALLFRPFVNSPLNLI